MMQSGREKVRGTVGNDATHCWNRDGTQVNLPNPVRIEDTER